MESIQKDLQQLSIKQKSASGGSFLQVVGYDVDSSFDRQMIFQLVQDTTSISTGGQIVKAGANIQSQVDDDSSFHYTHRMGVAFDLFTTTDDALQTLTGIIQNAVSLFDGSEMSIGQVSWTCTQHKYYSQQKLAKLSQSILEKIADGIGLKYRDYAQIPNLDGSIFIPSGVGANTAAEYQQLYYRQLLAHYGFRVEQVTDVANVGTQFKRFKAFVPLPCIFPALWELPDEGCVYTGLGQKIKLNMRLNPANECIMSNGVNAALDYNIRNMQLLKCYTKLDPIRNDLVLKSTVMLPKLDYANWVQNSCTQTINALYGVSAKDRIKGLIFGFHTNIRGKTFNSDETAVQAHLVNSTEATYKIPLCYHVQMPIDHISIDIGGQVYDINMQQLQLLHIASDAISGQCDSYQFPLQKQQHYVYYLDLQRFSHDLWGSSSKNITSCKITIQLKTGTKTLFGQADDWTNALFQNFGFYSYLEKQQMFECRNGVYKMAG